MRRIVVVDNIGRYVIGNGTDRDELPPNRQRRDINVDLIRHTCTNTVAAS